jgi:hypothetical protein
VSRVESETQSRLLLKYQYKQLLFVAYVDKLTNSNGKRKLLDILLVLQFDDVPLYTCICVCVRMCARMCVCINLLAQLVRAKSLPFDFLAVRDVQLYTCLQFSATGHLCVRVSVCVCACVCLSVSLSVCVCQRCRPPVCIFVCMYTCMCAYICLFFNTVLCHLHI